MDGLSFPRARHGEGNRNGRSFNEQRKWLSPWGLCSKLEEDAEKWPQEHLRLDTVS